MSLRYYILLLFCIFSFSGSSNTEISKSTWEKATKEISYTEDFKEFDKKEKKFDKKFDNDFKVGPALMILPLIILGIIVIVLIVLFIKNAPRVTVTKSLKNNSLLEETEDPDEFSQDDLDQYLKSALEDKNYRLAVRIHFLMLIKLLQQKDLITWKKEKTNFDYWRELKPALIRDGFKSLTLIFEKTWYANYPINEPKYKTVANKFSQLNVTINE